MKRILCALLAAIGLLSLTGCGGTAVSTGPEADSVDVDLTTLSSTMVYSEVFNMLSTPEDYLGKSVRMRGAFSVYHDEVTDHYYFACLIADATACCQQGFEFLWEGEHAYPDDYPPLGTEITVTGVFDTYTEGTYTYCQLIHAELSTGA